MISFELNAPSPTALMTIWLPIYHLNNYIIMTIKCETAEKTHVK